MTSIPGPAAMVDVLTPPCMMCSLGGVVTVPAPALDAYRAGALAQQAFPMLSADEREQLISGTHAACWDALMSGE